MTLIVALSPVAQTSIFGTACAHASHSHHTKEVDSRSIQVHTPTCYYSGNGKGVLAHLPLGFWLAFPANHPMGRITVGKQTSFLPSYALI